MKNGSKLVRNAGLVGLLAGSMALSGCVAREGHRARFDGPSLVAEGGNFMRHLLFEWGSGAVNPQRTEVYVNEACSGSAKDSGYFKLVGIAWTDYNNNGECSKSEAELGRKIFDSGKKIYLGGNRNLGVGVLSSDTSSPVKYTLENMDGERVSWGRHSPTIGITTTNNKRSPIYSGNFMDDFNGVINEEGDGRYLLTARQRGGKVDTLELEFHESGIIKKKPRK